MKIEKSIPWIIILAICTIVAFNSGIVFKKVKVDAGTATSKITANNNAPSIGTVILNGGSDITLVESVTTTVSATATISDTDGISDISTTTGKLYRSGVGSGCSADDNNCYVDSACATTTPCAATSCTVICNYDVWFHGDPTDTGSSWESEFWDAWIKVIDTENASSSATSTGVEMNTLRALDVTSDTWLGISSAELDSYCGTLGSDYDLEDALDGAGYWYHQIIEVHWFVLDLGETYTIKKVRGRSNMANYDPNDANIYIDDSNPPTTLIEEGIDWHNSSTWIETDITDSNGRYIKVEIEGTESGAPTALAFGAVPNFTIFDAYGDFGVINYGSLNSGSTTGSTNQGVTTTATGNVGIEVYVYGDDMEKGSDSIGVGYQEYSTSTFTYASGTDLSNSSTSVEVDMSKPTSHPSTSTDDIYWGAEVPAVTPKGTYTGTTTFEAGEL